MKIHKVYWWSNQKSKPPIIFAGHISMCGAKWVAGSHLWKHVNCKRCLRRKTKK